MKNHFHNFNYKTQIQLSTSHPSNRIMCRNTVRATIKVRDLKRTQTSRDESPQHKVLPHLDVIIQENRCMNVIVTQA